MTEAQSGFRSRPISQHFEANGLRIHFLDWGEEAASQLILLHGLGSNAHTWDDFGKESYASHRIVAPDLRGHGESSYAADGYTLEKFAADVKATARYMNMRTFDLVGHSLGAFIAIRFAAENPGLVRRLVLEDGGPGLDTATARQGAEESFRRPLGFATEEQAIAWLRAQRPNETDEAVKRRFTYGMKQNWAGKWVPRIDHELYWILGGSEKFTAEFEGLWDNLKALRCPTLLVHGENSPLLSAEGARRIVDAIPNGRLVDIPNAGHSIHSDQPALYKEAVLRFLGE